MNRASQRQPILIMAGGTGGHVFPALAVAEQLQAQGWPVAWLGTRTGLEARVIPPTGIPVYWISVSGLRGKGVLHLLTAPFMLAWALLQAARILLQVRPAAVLGMGGFVTGPGGAMAWLLRRPLLVHEQNSVAGLTNRWLAHVARCVLEAFPGSLPNALHTGNPLRESIARTAFSESDVQSRQPHLLVVGGSLGAAVFNEQVPQALAALEPQQRPAVWHQTGLKHIDAARQAYASAGVDVRLDAFIDDMATAYQWADLVLCRAGAMTVAELAAVGVASILVPYPHAVDDHQTGNARFLVDAGAALLLPQQDMTPLGLLEHFRLLQQPEKLRDMARKAHARAMPDAAKQVAGHCIDATGWRAAA